MSACIPAQRLSPSSSMHAAPAPPCAGVPQRSRDSRSLLATVNGPVPAGSTRLPVGAACHCRRWACACACAHPAIRGGAALPGAEPSGSPVGVAAAPAQPAAPAVPAAQVDTSARLQVGQRVRLFVNDASTLSEGLGCREAACGQQQLAAHCLASTARQVGASHCTNCKAICWQLPAQKHATLGTACVPLAASRRRLHHNERTTGASTAHSAGGIAIVEPAPARVAGEPLPAWMADDPVWQAAAEGQLTLGAGSGEGLSVEQALEADAEADAQAAADDSRANELGLGGAAPAPESADSFAGTAGRAAANTIAAWCAPLRPLTLPTSGSSVMHARFSRLQFSHQCCPATPARSALQDLRGAAGGQRQWGCAG